MWCLQNNMVLTYINIEIILLPLWLHYVPLVLKIKTRILYHLMYPNVVI